MEDSNVVSSNDYDQPLPVIRDPSMAYVLTTLVAALLAVSSIAGLLFGQHGLYDSNLTTLPAFLTQDVLSLLVAIPLLSASAWITRRGSVRGLLLWMGTLFYVAYAYAYGVLGDHLAPLFLVYAAIVSMSLYGLVYLLVSIDADAVRARFAVHTPTRLTGGFVAFMAVLMGTIWAAGIVADLYSGISPSRVQLVVWPLDLVVAFPALFWGGVWLWRKQALGYVVGGIILLKAAAEGLTLVAQTSATVLMGGQYDPMLPAYAVVGVGGLVLLIVYLRCVLPRASEPRRARRLQHASRLLPGQASR
jgi:hypothetical protein